MVRIACSLENMNFARFLVLFSILLVPAIRAEENLKISNADFEVDYDPASTGFSIRYKPMGRTFA